ncbi:metal ABC transporter substrate-binding protein [Microvirga sp. GCM10011540]|uniref:metal ABC transporter substrate-binding protein n=1 Tax=Microvirga sp. GCM10011540 TaxID=3317338 RepID=UPI0036150D06
MATYNILYAIASDSVAVQSRCTLVLSASHNPGGPAHLTSQVGGDRIEVSTLVDPDGDAHVFSPKPANAKKIADARVVMVNGLGFEGWMNRLIRSSGSKAALVTASTGVKPLRNEEHGHGHGLPGHSHGEFDPHAWQDVANTKIYVTNIRDGLTKADPESKDVYEANTKAYLARLDALDAEVKAAVGSIPQERRNVVTTHDAFGYFDKAYGLEFVSPQGVSTDAEAADRAADQEGAHPGGVPGEHLGSAPDREHLQGVGSVDR